jgi:hypothetical protein
LTLPENPIAYKPQFHPIARISNSKNLTFSLQPTWEIAYNHYHNRLGHDLPKIAAVLPLVRPTGADHHMAWESLTHAEMGAVGLPPLAAGK